MVLRWLVVVLLGVLPLAGVLYIGYVGYMYKPWWEGSSDKEFWDYLELLIVPVALAIGVYWLSNAQERAQGRERQAQEAQQLEFANQATQDAALRTYIEQMTQLLISKSAHELLSENRLREPIHARTLHALEEMDETTKGRHRKRALLQFLYKTELIPGRQPQGPPHEQSLLFGGNLKDANLKDLTLEGANLRGANLRGANLAEAELGEADLTGADLRKANLEGANLTRAKLEDAYLQEANLQRAHLVEVKLERATLAGADLTKADLKGAIVNQGQLDAISFLEGATMPNGQKYEDWLKDKKDRQEDRDPS